VTHVIAIDADTRPGDTPAPPPRLPVPARRDPDERARNQRLMRLHGPGELGAALLALVLTPGSQRELAAWRHEVAQVPAADAIRRDIAELDAFARLPWFELLSLRLARAPAAQRVHLAQAVRRVMRADGRVGPLDWLLWLTLRRQLGERPVRATLPSAGAENDLTALDAPEVAAVAQVTAFLSRVVPHREPDVLLGGDGDVPVGQLWYEAVVARWPEPPARGRVDGDTLSRAMRCVQALPWMLRPVLVRVWFEETSALVHGRALTVAAADALRMTALLLDSPLPTGLAAQFKEPPCR
jgi:hypothetical protein